jgi:hypothetical protein
MISKFIISIFIFLSVFYTIGCCTNACSFPPGATADITYEDGSIDRVVVDANGCVSPDCDKSSNIDVRLVTNPQV